MNTAAQCRVRLRTSAVARVRRVARRAFGGRAGHGWVVRVNGFACSLGASRASFAVALLAGACSVAYVVGLMARPAVGMSCHFIGSQRSSLSMAGGTALRLLGPEGMGGVTTGAAGVTRKKRALRIHDWRFARVAGLARLNGLSWRVHLGVTALARGGLASAMSLPVLEIQVCMTGPARRR